MRRKLAAAVSLMLLFSVMPLTGLIAQATANPFELSFPSIRIISPPDPPNRYENNTVQLKIAADTLVDAPKIYSISYSLDGAPPVAVQFTVRNASWAPYLVGYIAEAVVQLSGLSEGSHKIVACAKDYNGKEMVKASRSFTVNSNYQVTVIEVLSPQPRAYSSGEVPLVFTVNGEFGNGTYHILKPISAASGIGGTEIEGNTTLTGLPDGSYQVLLYLSAEGKGASKAYAEFRVNAAEAINSTNGRQPELLGSPLIIAFIAVFCVVGVWLLVYLKKPRPPNRSSQKLQISKTCTGDNS